MSQDIGKDGDAAQADGPAELCLLFEDPDPLTTGESTVPNSVLEAIKQGIWDYEPKEEPRHNQPATSAMPGTREKLDVLAERVRQGLPLWNPSDRICYDGNQSRD